MRAWSYLAACLFSAALAAAASAAAGPPAGPATGPAAKPNVVVILADDLGYGDVSFNGATRVQTPNVDRLAAEGLRFTGGYCSASTCTPTRFSMLTGTYAFRQKGTGIAAPNAPALIQPGTPTVASLLKQAGYATGVVGKWHLGLGGPGGPQWNGQLKPGPLDIGFDYAFLMPTTNDRVPQVYVENDRVLNLDPKDPLWVGMAKPSPDHPNGVDNRDRLRMDWSAGHNNSIHNGIGRIGFYTGGTAARFRDEDLADAWVAHAVKWMGEVKDKPFFLYYAPHDIHVPRVPNERFQGKTPMGPRGDAIVEFDWQVGELVKALDRMGVADNTLVILTSDNGPVLDDGYKDGAVEKLGDHRPAGPYSGGKTTIKEGGTRVPFVTHWPGRVKPGVSAEVVCTIDLPASLATLTGVPLPADGLLDSLDVSGALLGEPGAKGRASLVEQNNNGENLGFRAGRWKLQKVRPPKAAAPTFHLYDLDADPAEAHDVAAERTAEVEQLKQDLAAAVAARTRPAVK